MPLQKQAVSVNFDQGVDTFSDPNQLSFGKFTALSNAVFIKEGASQFADLTKRNGFGSLTTLPNASSKFITTYNETLLAIGGDVKGYSEGPNFWASKGTYLPLSLKTQSIIQNSNNQQFADIAQINGLTCTAYLEYVALTTLIGGTVSSVSYVPNARYVISNLNTGEQISQSQLIVPSFGSVNFSPRVYAYGSKFVLLFDGTIGSQSHLEYKWIDATNPSSVSSSTLVSSNFAPAFPQAFDAVVASNSLFISWSAKSSSSVFTGYLNSNFGLTGPVTASSQYSQSASIRMSADLSGVAPVIWTTYVSNLINLPPVFLGRPLKTFATDTNLNFVVPSIDILSDVSGAITLASVYFQIANNIICNASGGVNTTFIEFGGRRLIYGTNLSPVNDPKNPGTSFPVNFASNTIGVLSVPQTISSGTVNNQRLGFGNASLGLAAGPFNISSVTYVLAEYQSQYQSTYFLVNSSGFIAAKLAYGNGYGDSLTEGNYLPYGVGKGFSIGTTTGFIPYIFKDSITPVNKDTNVSSSVQTSGIYSQYGIALCDFDFATSNIIAIEAGQNLNLNGGYVWQYDGTVPKEYGTHLYPDLSIALTGSGSAVGSMTSQSYFYQATYSYIDNKGNIIESAASLPFNVNLGVAGSITTTSTVVTVPMLTVAGSVTFANTKINLYRWSTSQPIYYLVESENQNTTSPTYLGNGVFIDKHTDAAILGNKILYTTGGVLENTPPPSPTAVTLFDSRLWLIDAEDQNLLWYSKQLIENVPVEMSNLLTYFVPPSTSSVNSTGPMKCICPMDDKLIIFKNNSIFYINGTGPDNTGANNQYSQPILITNGVGCDNQNSIILVPKGLMFKSNKGIWLLGRDLSLDFVGKDVESYNLSKVLSATLIPGTNQARFTLDSGIMLMYDYFVGQWGTFNINGISSVIYNGLHTYLDSSGNVFRETPGVYSDGSTAVVMSFTTGWVSLAGVQGYKRIYKMFMLANYKTPHALTGSIAYDFNPNSLQNFQIIPTNTLGSGSQVEQWQINFDQQQCQSFQLSVSEISSVSAGQGLTISAFRILAGIKSDTPKNIGVSNKIS